MLTTFLSLSLLSLSLNTSIDASEENIEVSQRPTSLQDIKKMKEQKEDGEEAHLEGSTEKFGFRSKGPSTHSFFFRESATTPNHWIVSSNIDGSILEIEDGSHWKIASGSSLSRWRIGDIITITPNRSWFSDYKYYVINKSIDEYVAADLILGPIAYGSLTHWAVSLDFSQGKVVFENGSCFKICSSDLFLFEQWQINDTIIFGTNDSWFTSYDILLINVNMNHYVRAKQY